MFLAIAVVLFALCVLGFGIIHVEGVFIDLPVLLAIISLMWHFVAVCSRSNGWPV